jgi:hypothetical protein
VVKDPITDEPPIGELLKVATSGILAEHPKIQPLSLWTMIRRLHPATQKTIEIFYIFQLYVKYLRSVTALNPTGRVIRDYTTHRWRTSRNIAYGIKSIFETGWGVPMLPLLLT